MALVLGIGCDRNTSLKTLEDAIDCALQSAMLDKNCISTIATIDKKNDEHAILQLAKKYHWCLRFYSPQQLAKIAVPHPSNTVLKYMGTPSVSEAAAILAAQSNQQHLLIEKYKFLGKDGKNATISAVQMAT